MFEFWKGVGENVGVLFVAMISDIDMLRSLVFWLASRNGFGGFIIGVQDGRWQID